ncbi:PEP-CTERM sorting domain-containing protein [Duganella sp. S19_KUP01_CR8]|uniref:PEP-CTERM sorting domain-containing protein n=1 Tax=Duganella sp. S19_KUP01_CR8 TaxID=3025502 RepID=UPI002FCD7F9C
MLKKLLSVALLAISSTAAQAAPTHYYYTYTGLFADIYNQAYEFQPDASYGGRFDGEDLNHNNIIELSELTYMRSGYTNYLNCNAYCGVSSFSYDLNNGKLEFYTSYSNTYQGVSYGGGSASELGYTWHYDFPPYYDNRMSVTPETKLTISVPEPSTYLMLGVGLLGIGLVKRRRK